jgi:arylsulfatase A-like enzyme
MERRKAGTSLLPVIKGEDHPEEISVTEKEMRGESHLRFGFRTQDWKFMYDGKHDERYLFDLDEDPDEKENVVDEHDEVRERFESVLEDRLESIEKTGADIQIPDVDDEPGVEEQLRALGYQE